MTSMLAIDPVVVWLLRTCLALLFAAAAAHKLRDFDGFARVLADYQLLPRALNRLAAGALIAVEILIAAALWVASAGAISAAAVLAIYAVAVGVNLVRGRRDIECGCAGPGGGQTLSVAIVVRNLLLAGLALLSALPASNRPLTLVDIATLVFGASGLGLTYVAADFLLAQEPRLSLLRRETIDA